MNAFSEPVPLGLYVHVPWCVRKCPYCDFNSHAQKGEIPEQAYIAALLRDIEQDLPLVWGRRIGSVFIGGGTPSLLGPDAVHGLLAGIRARLPIVPGTEITLEANPGTVEAGRFAAYREAGVTRLSMGVQSFDDRSLEAIGRIHDGQQAVAAFEQARRAGFDNINLDLMFGLPGQDPAAVDRDLRQAIALAPEHLSHYQLTLEPNTPFHRDPPPLPADDLAWTMQAESQDLLARAGYAQYEVSAFARDAWRCRHNLNYWEYGDYLGVGAGAHAKLTLAAEGRILRLAKKRHPKDYLAAYGSGDFVSSRQVLEADELVLEFMMNALRLTDGVARVLFERHTGLPWDRVADTCSHAVQRGLMVDRSDRIQTTDLGRRFLNDLLALF